MITLTTEATDVIREMVGNAELPDTGGLRLDIDLLKDQFGVV